MYIATFGPKGFIVNSEKIITFDNFETTSSIVTEKLDNEGKKPSTYDKGPDLDTLNFKVSIDENFGTTPDVQHQQWLDVLNKNQAWPLLIGGKPFNNTKYKLKKVHTTDSKFDNKGNWLRTTISLEFEEFVREGKPKKKDSSTATRTNSTTSAVYLALKPEEKEYLKLPETKVSREYRHPVLEIARTPAGAD